MPSRGSELIWLHQEHRIGGVDLAKLESLSGRAQYRVRFRVLGRSSGRILCRLQGEAIIC